MKYSRLAAGGLIAVGASLCMAPAALAVVHAHGGGGHYHGGGMHGGGFHGGGGYHAGGAWHGGGAGYHGGGVYHGGGYAWRNYGWAPGGAIAAGAAIGFLGAAAVASWAPPPPQPGLCWYYTDPSQQNGFWDACP